MSSLPLPDDARVTLTVGQLRELVEKRALEIADERYTRRTAHMRRGEHGVYVVHNPESRRIKIGRTSNPGRRLGALRRASGVELQMLRWFPSESHDHAVEFERHLHHEFRRSRLPRTEWFEMTDEIVKWLRRLGVAGRDG